MRWFRDQYNPVDTETFAFFGNPKPHARISPVSRFFRDVGNVFIHATMIPVVLATFQTDRNIDELYLYPPSVLSLVWFTICSLIQVPAILIVLTFFMTSAAALSALTWIHSIVLWRVIQGPKLQVYPPEPPPGYNPRQRWVYVNGIATGKTITRQNLECLSATFHNPVLAINNRTYGFLGDILECVIQRSFEFRTKETSVATNILKGYLHDHNNVDKVILIAHSQGGIIASQILDDLYSSLSHDELAKLEVYTFGSAALKFSNPWRDGHHTARIVPVMEHYCNERDMVTSWGALLSSSRDEKDRLFVGKVFVFQGQTGHMLNQHYLQYMFTGMMQTWREDNFQLRAVRRDDRVADKFYVLGHRAKLGAGEESVQSLSNLWRYMR